MGAMGMPASTLGDSDSPMQKEGSKVVAARVGVHR